MDSQTTDQEKVFYHDATNIGTIAAAYFIELLFLEKPKTLESKDVLDAMGEQFGALLPFFDSNELKIFFLKEPMATYEDGKKMPVGLSISGPLPFDQTDVDDMARSQCWNLEDVETLLERCQWRILMGDYMAAGLDSQERGTLLQKWCDLVMNLYPNCYAVRYRPSEKIMTAAECKANPFAQDIRFLNGAINVRFFQVAGKEEYLVDTLGLYAIGLPDIQCHFHTCNPNDMVNLTFDVAAYIFRNGDLIKDGETVPGLEEDDWWKCQHEASMAHPDRVVLDIHAGKYAAGQRVDV